MSKIWKTCGALLFLNFFIAFKLFAASFSCQWFFLGGTGILDIPQISLDPRPPHPKLKSTPALEELVSDLRANSAALSENQVLKFKKNMAIHLNTNGVQAMEEGSTLVISTQGRHILNQIARRLTTRYGIKLIYDPQRLQNVGGAFSLAGDTFFVDYNTLINLRPSGSFNHEYRHVTESLYYHRSKKIDSLLNGRLMAHQDLPFDGLGVYGKGFYVVEISEFTHDIFYQLQVGIAPLIRKAKDADPAAVLIERAMTVSEQIESSMGTLGRMVRAKVQANRAALLALETQPFAPSSRELYTGGGLSMDFRYTDEGIRVFLNFPAEFTGDLNKKISMEENLRDLPKELHSRPFGKEATTKVSELLAQRFRDQIAFGEAFLEYLDRAQFAFTRAAETAQIQTWEEVLKNVRLMEQTVNSAVHREFVNN